MKFITIILAAGKGTRMNSELPKVLHQVGKKPLISHVINTAKEIGSQQIVVVVGYGAELVQKELSGSNVDFALQKEQLGTGHAVLSAKEICDIAETILVLSGDVPLLSKNTLEKLLKKQYSVGAAGTVLSGVSTNPFGYGRIIRDENGLLQKIVEHKDATENEQKISEVNAGIYAFNTELLWKYLAMVKNENNQSEYYLPDVFSLFLSSGKKVGIYQMDDFSEAQGINTLEQLSAVDKRFYNKV